MSVRLLSGEHTKRGRMQRIVLELLAEKEHRGEIPTNGRFVFYELEQRGLVRKSRQGESRRERADELPREQAVTDALMWLREKGLVPYWWIVDETRTLYGYDRPATVAAAVREAIESVEVDPWRGEAPLVLCESRSLVGVLRELCDEYRCLVAATNGQAGGFLRTEIAPLLGDMRPVLYLGDLDHQGAQIEENTRRVLEHGVGFGLDWRRLAITAEQVAGRKLAPIVKTDARYRPALVHEAWETEALTQSVIVQLVRAALEALLPEPLADVLERERAERAGWLARLDGGGG